MIQAVHRLEGAELPTRTDIELADLAEAARSARWVWLDLLSPTEAEIDLLGAVLDLDELTIDDINEELQFPKVEEFDAYLTVVFHSLSTSSDRVATVEVDAILTRTVLVTFHHDEVPGTDFVRNRILRGIDVPETPDELLADITEIAARRFLPVVDELDLKILDVQELALSGDSEVLAEVQALQRDAAILRRMLGPQRRVLLGLSRDKRPLVDERARRVFRDAYDDHVRTVESLDSANNMLSSAIDTYRGAAAERMNEVMKVLTLFSATLLPPTLIAGIYGMNFQHMPETEARWGYPLILGVMGVMVISLWVYFARRGFLRVPKSFSSRGERVRGLGRGLAEVASAPVRTIGGSRRRRPPTDT